MIKEIASSLWNGFLAMLHLNWKMVVNDNNYSTSKENIRKKGRENDRCRYPKITRPSLLYLWQNHR